MPEPGLPPDARAAARGGTTQLLLQTAARVFGIAFVLVVTRQLGPSQFGRYSVVAALLVIGNFLADFGTSPSVTRLVSRNPREADAVLAATVPVSLVLGLVGYAGVLGFAAVVYPHRQFVDVAIGCAAIPANSVLTTVFGAMDGVGLIARRALVGFLQTLVVVAGLVPVLAGGGVRGPIITLGLAPYFALAVAVPVARRGAGWRTLLSSDGSQRRRMLRVALPFALSGGLTALSMRFDVILLSVTHGRAETAAYDIAQRVVEACTFPAIAVAGALLFLLNRRLGDGDLDGARRAYGEGVRVLYAIGLPASATLAALAHPLTRAVFGATFDEAAAPLAILGAVLWLGFIVYLQDTLVMSGDHVRQGMGVIITNTGVTLGLDAVAVPAWGPKGAALAAVVATVFTVVNLDRFHRRTTGIAVPLPHWGLVAATAALALAELGLRHQPLVLALAAGVVAYLAVVAGTRSISFKDFKRLRS